MENYFPVIKHWQVNVLCDGDKQALIIPCHNAQQARAICNRLKQDTRVRELATYRRTSIWSPYFEVADEHWKRP